MSDTKEKKTRKKKSTSKKSALDAPKKIKQIETSGSGTESDPTVLNPNGEKNQFGIVPLPKVGYEDMTKMEDMTLDGVLDNLMERYNQNLIYTFTSSILVAINPYQWLDIFHSGWVRFYKGKRIGINAPHVYAVAEAAYTCMLDHEVNQSCLVSGESGAGKTETTKLIMQFLSARTEREYDTSIDQKVLASFPVLEALGNAKTGRNDNSSRFGKFIEIQFNEDGFIVGSKIIPYLLEKSRIVGQAKGERNYHIFYNLTEGMSEEERAKFHLYRAEKFTYLNTTGCYTVKGVSEAEELKGFKDALTLYEVSDEVQANIFAIVSCVLHLGNISFNPKGDTAEYIGESEKSLSVISELMGLDLEKLKWGLTNRQIKTMREVIDKPLGPGQAKDTCDTFAKYIYATLFEWTVTQLNAVCMADSYKSFIGVLDIFGFEVFEHNSFEQFLINYTNEKLQQFFNHQIFKLEQAIYEEEKIDWSVIEFKDNQECLDLIEKRRPPGILSILDEESKFPRATDDSLIEKLHNNFDGKSEYYEKPRLKRRQFAVKHFAGSVTYEVTGWRDKNKDELPDHLTQLLQDSSNSFISILYTGEQANPQNEPVLREGKDDSLRPASANRKISYGDRSGGGKKDSKSSLTMGGKFKQQLLDLMTMLGATEPYFVRCIKPNSVKKPNTLDQKMTYDQLLYSGMLETIRIRRMGYPIRYSHSDFFKRFKCISPEVALTDDEKATAEALVKAMGCDIPNEAQIGLTKVFLKQHTANDLEDRRLVALTSVIVRCQQWWRLANTRVRFMEHRENATIVQTWYRWAHARSTFVKKRNSAILLQSVWRIIKAQRARKKLIEKKRKEEEARRKKEEEERKKRIAKYGKEKVEQEEAEKQKEEAEKIRAAVAGVSLGNVEREEEEKKKDKKKALQRSASIKMEKMQELEVPINVDGKIILGLGWKSSKWELDISLLLFRYQTHREDVYFYKPRSREGAVVHKSGWSGRKGKKMSPLGGVVDCEHLELNLSKLSSKTNTIVIIATVFNPKGNFSSVKDAYVRLVDPNSAHEYCHYPLEKCGTETAKIICKLFRTGFTRWRLKAIGESSDGRVYKHMISKVKPFLSEAPKKRKLKVCVHSSELTFKYPEGQEPGTKSNLNCFAYIRYDTTTEKSKHYKKSPAPKSNETFTANFDTTKTLSGQANDVEITIMSTGKKRMGAASEKFLGRAIIPLDTKSKTAISSKVFKLEEWDKEWAQNLVQTAGSIKVSIDEL